MGRRPRAEFKGIFHVIKRGNNREYIFRAEEDMEQAEPIIKAIDFYEEGDVIGEDEQETNATATQNQNNAEDILDELLRRVVALYHPMKFIRQVA